MSTSRASLVATLEYATARALAAAEFEGPAAELYFLVTSARANSMRLRLARLDAEEAAADAPVIGPSSPEVLS